MSTLHPGHEDTEAINSNFREWPERNVSKSLSEPLNYWIFFFFSEIIHLIVRHVNITKYDMYFCDVYKVLLCAIFLFFPFTVGSDSSCIFGWGMS